MATAKQIAAAKRNLAKARAAKKKRYPGKSSRNAVAGILALGPTDFSANYWLQHGNVRTVSKRKRR